MWNDREIVNSMRECHHNIVLDYSQIECRASILFDNLRFRSILVAGRCRNINVIQVFRKRD